MPGYITVEWLADLVRCCKLVDWTVNIPNYLLSFLLLFNRMIQVSISRLFHVLFPNMNTDEASIRNGREGSSKLSCDCSFIAQSSSLYSAFLHFSSRSDSHAYMLSCLDSNFIVSLLMMSWLARNVSNEIISGVSLSISIIRYGYTLWHRLLCQVHCDSYAL